MAGEFTLEDLKDQLASMKKMGPLEGLLDLLPKGGAFKALKAPESVDEKALVRVTAMIDSMTPDERRYPQVLNGSRKKRIAAGSGTSVAEINRLLKQYQQMRKLMRSARKGCGGWICRDWTCGPRAWRCRRPQSACSRLRRLIV